jgi:carboxyl-terminal processing protease
MKSSSKKLLIVVAIIMMIGGAYYLGYGIGNKSLLASHNSSSKVVNINRSKPENVDFGIFWEAWNIVEKEFIKKDIDYQKMIYGAISGMLSSLGDSYTAFMTPEESQMLSEDLNGSFGGIGVEITAKDGFLVIIAPLDGSPAHSSGIKSGDIITKINGNDVGDYTFIEAINQIRGEKGTTVVLTIISKDEDDAKDVEIMRDTISVESVKWKIIEDDIMYIRISQFGEDVFDNIGKSIEELRRENINKVIVDVRDNPGGYLDACVDATSLFVPEDVIVWEENREKKQTSINSTHLPRLDKIGKLIVLVNSGSASSSEIFAGAIQDYKTGVIVGEKTFGKGSVQNLEKISGGGQVKITVAKWLTPQKRQIEKEGILPDIEIDMDSGQIGTDDDRQLMRAIEEVRK